MSERARVTEPVMERPVSNPGGAGFGSAMASELTKLRSTRSFLWICAVSAVLTIGIAVIVGLTNNGPFDNGAGLAQPLLLGFVFLQFVFLGWGAQLGSTEFSTGMILSSVTAVPNRVRLLLAKLATLMIFTLFFGLLLAVVAFVIGWSLMGDRHGPFGLTDPDVVLAVLLQPVFLALLAGIALALGFIVKVPAGAVISAIGMILLPLILVIFPSEVVKTIATAFPALHAGSTVFAADQTLAMSLVVLGCWLAVTNVVAVILFRRRDI